MTLAQLNAKIFALPRFSLGELDQAEARVIRDTRLGILGVHADMDLSEEQVQIVHDELFPVADQKDLL